VASAFSDDGKRLITVGQDGTVCLWELPRNPDLRSGPIPEDPADEKALAALAGRPIPLANGTTVQVGRAARGAQLSAPRAADGVIEHAAFTSSGDHVVTTGADGTARVWDVATGRPVTPPLRHRDTVVYAAFSPDGLRLLTASKDRTARLWDAVRGELLSPPLRHGRDIKRVLFGPDGSRAFVVCAGGAVASWDLTPDTRSADELVLLAEVESCGRVDEKQTRQTLGPAALRSAWEKLQSAR
jgi:hypothetical protein